MSLLTGPKQTQSFSVQIEDDKDNIAVFLSLLIACEAPRISSCNKNQYSQYFETPQ